MLTQGEAVYNAIQSIQSFDDGDKVSLSKEEKAQVVQILSAGFEAGEIRLSEVACHKYLGEGNEQALKTYVGGLINNWTRKDLRMNGGPKYEPKDPGSRAGSGDALVKNLKALKASGQVTDEDKMAELDTAIANRIAEVKASKAKKVEVDYSVIDPKLLESLNIEIKEA